MAIAFDAAVAFDSPLYTFDGELITPSGDTSFLRSTYRGPDSRLTIRSSFRVAFDQTTAATVRE